MRFLGKAVLRSACRVLERQRHRRRLREGLGSAQLDEPADPRVVCARLRVWRLGHAAPPCPFWPESRPLLARGGGQVRPRHRVTSGDLRPSSLVCEAGNAPFVAPRRSFNRDNGDHGQANHPYTRRGRRRSLRHCRCRMACVGQRHPPPGTVSQSVIAQNNSSQTKSTFILHPPTPRWLARGGAPPRGSAAPG